ncbi:hypothetical protein [Paenibacillus arenosi]|uniref:SMI1/KNR4 family protein n=1 Tax=Paenibacillus arenosi TaxID=2774142 RepID=A0ABR9AVP6_9BACL|nr:hypothetical protein [Paenibacillus arenosi]MBD8497302.1 hypothetical protein [Paenibacillus arenosi]
MKKAKIEELNQITRLFKRIDIENVETPQNYFNFVGTLDVFPRCLTEKESLDLINEDYNAKHIDKYISFFELCMTTISEPVYVYKRPLLGDGDSRDDSELCKVTTIDEIHPFIISIGREQCFYNFFWKDSRTVVIGNFDLSLPIYSDVQHIHTFKACAADSELFIRT